MKHELDSRRKHLLSLERMLAKLSKQSEMMQKEKGIAELKERIRSEKFLLHFQELTGHLPDLSREINIIPTFVNERIQQSYLDLERLKRRFIVELETDSFVERVLLSWIISNKQGPHLINKLCKRMHYFITLTKHQKGSKLVDELERLIDEALDTSASIRQIQRCSTINPDSGSVLEELDMSLLQLKTKLYIQRSEFANKLARTLADRLLVPNEAHFQDNHEYTGDDDFERAKFQIGIQEVEYLLNGNQFLTALNKLSIMQSNFPSQAKVIEHFIAECNKRWAVWLLSEGDLQEALSKFEKSLYFEPYNVDTRERLDNLLVVLKLDPQSEDIRLELAKQAKLRGDKEAAVIEYEAAYKIGSNYRILMDLAEVLELLEEYDRAKEVYNRILQKHLPDPESKAIAENKLAILEK